MGPLVWCAGKLSRVVVVSARTSQTMVIEVVDRLARDRHADRVRLLGRLWAAQLDLLATALGDPERVMDDSYDAATRLLALHREFAHRLLEITDHDNPAIRPSEPI